MGSSQSLRKPPNAKEEQSTHQIQEISQLEVQKTSNKYLPPIHNQRYQKKGVGLKSTQENPFQMSQSQSSGSSQKDTPRKSFAKIAEESMQIQQFQWPNEISNSQVFGMSLSRNTFEPQKAYSQDLSVPPRLSPVYGDSRFKKESVAKSVTFEHRRSKEPQQVLRLNYQVIEKKTEFVKLAIVGARPAVGKSTLIKSFVTQSEDFDTKQTIGSDISFFNFHLDDLVIVKLQLWELESSEQSLDQWEKQIESTFDGIIMVFDEFGEECAERIRHRIELLQKISNIQNRTGTRTITMVGNDRLNMNVTGKEPDIRRAVNKLYDGNDIKVRIIDPRQLKEINSLFKGILQDIIKVRVS